MSKGGATVESKEGQTEIDAHFDRLLAPTRFGREYLTYVLWAVTPDGLAKNLGEILVGSSDKARLRVTTDLQAFGLIVTLVELYEARNAVQIAQSAEAERYAPETLAKAQDLLRRAQHAQDRKAGVTSVVTLARQAAQTAEDARILAIQRKQDSELARAKEQAARADALRARAETAAQTAQSQAAAERALLEQERAAKQKAEAQAAAAAAAAQQAPQTPAQTRTAPDRDEPQKKELRLLLLGQFNTVLSVRDTPRGLTLTVTESDFQGTRVSPAVYASLARVVSVLRAHPDLTVEVDGHERFSSERAQAVRDVW